MFHSFSLIDWMQAIFFKKLFDCLLVLLGIRLSEDTFWDTLVKISYTVKFASVYVCLLIKRNVVHFICRLWRFMFLSNAGNVWYTSPLNITIHKKHSLSLSNKLILEPHVVLYVLWLVWKVEYIFVCTESENRRRSQTFGVI